MKKAIAVILALVLVLSIPCAYAKSKKMEANVPVWTEETVRQYAMDYIEGKNLDTLWGYYDLQVRRYMPQDSFESILLDLQFLTGKFISLGSYRCFEEEELQLKTHVLHLCMEKMDLDMYFTHKNQEDDWEVMALEFVPAEREETELSMLVEDNIYVAPEMYQDTEITVGTDEYPLGGILTLPLDASVENPVPAVVLVHDDGELDRHMTVGQTALFDDLADLFGDMGIAVIRYDKRTYVYPDAPIDTVEAEVIEDAISAVRYAHQVEEIDSENIYVLGVGFGGYLSSRIAKESDDMTAGIIIVSGFTMSKLEYDWNHLQDTVEEDEKATYKNAVKKLKSMKESKASELTLFGHNGYYYWEMMQFAQTDTIKKLKIPTLIVHSQSDVIVEKADGLTAYQKAIGKSSKFVTYLDVRNLNHYLMNDLSVNEYGLPEYDYPAHLDLVTGREMGNWILTQSEK